ncbi:MAG: glycosyl hydrolase family 18 protein [Polyangiales bacterium]
MGGAGTSRAFAAPGARPACGAFVAAITRFMTDYGYDGVDVDVEPLQRGDAAAFQAFVRALRASSTPRDRARCSPLRRATRPGAYPRAGALRPDQRVMTYDLSGPWPG